MKVGTQDALLCLILDVADGISNQQQETRAVHSRTARCVAAEGGGFRKPASSTRQYKLKAMTFM